MDRLNEMQAFVNVVDQGGFTDAARKLGVSKSAISKHVAALEDRLGARLLNRTTRRVSPTEIGLAFYDRAIRVLSEAEDAEAMVTAMQEAPRGELRVSAPVSLGLSRIAPAVPDFLLEYPDISLHMVLDDRFVELVAEGFDMAIRVGDLPDSSLRARRLGDVRTHLAASPDYIARRGMPTSLQDLASHELLHYSNLSSGNFWRLLGPNGNERQIRATGRLTVNNGDALLQAAKGGLGIGMFPDFILGDALETGALVAVLPEACPPPLGIHAVYPPGRFPQPKLRAFIDHLAEAFRGDGAVASLESARRA
ncbi:LysR substrate-binding domain-containing protein [Rhodovulum sp. DZ06]|uniref:LysR family transcriptional regulator n=1 Tax=Rhodovulum sp. DZ06 TaxID=3425126 RepID=UPI003D35274E